MDLLAGINPCFSRNRGEKLVCLFPTFTSVSAGLLLAYCCTDSLHVILEFSHTLMSRTRAERQRSEPFPSFPCSFAPQRSTEPSQTNHLKLPGRQRSACEAATVWEPAPSASQPGGRTSSGLRCWRAGCGEGYDESLRGESLSGCCVKQLSR